MIDFSHNEYSNSNIYLFYFNIILLIYLMNSCLILAVLSISMSQTSSQSCTVPAGREPGLSQVLITHQHSAALCSQLICIGQGSIMSRTGRVNLTGPMTPSYTHIDQSHLWLDLCSGSEKRQQTPQGSTIGTARMLHRNESLSFARLWRICIIILHLIIKFCTWTLLG